MIGPCAKKHVVCYIVAESGEIFSGANLCVNPQAVCPRLPGEGYEKCRSICQQPCHAEEAALVRAGEKAKGGRAYIVGINRYCENCQVKLFDAGIVSLHRGMPC